jgi:Secretion system C-terminal sorting domain
MRKIYLLTLLVSLFALAKAQTFTVLPSSTSNTTVDVNGSREATIYFRNNFQTPIDLVWDVTSQAGSYPSAWFITVCDNQACFSLPHPTDSMAPVAALDSGFLKLACAPGGVAGQGFVSFNVYDFNSPTSSVNVTFNFTANEFVAVTPSSFEERFAVSPNPAQDYVRLSGRGSLLDKGMVTLLDMQGRQVLTQEVAAVQSADFSVASLTPGMYVLRYSTKAGDMTRKVVVAH